jgi:hypothetical protein
MDILQPLAGCSAAWQKHAPHMRAPIHALSRRARMSLHALRIHGADMRNHSRFEPQSAHEPACAAHIQCRHAQPFTL